MKITDNVNPNRINRLPDKTFQLLSGEFVEQGFTVKLIELRQFVEKTDEKLGPYSLITSLVDTDKGQVEMIYDEGFRGENALERAATFVLNNLGLSGIILRSIIYLNQELEK
ncbi:MAG TPA: hypothetical protein VIG05_08000 [Candidatus Nitrosotenuis sp.]